ncbi:MAG: VOC family protein [Dehalococcoidia bacterium]
MQIDHVIIAVNDLDDAAHHFRDRFGLIALPGGTHPMGTANRAIPLKAPQYIELLGVNQQELLRSHQFGDLLLHRLSQGDGLLTWAVRVDDIDAEAARLQRPAIPGKWEGPDGQVSRWHNVFPDFDDFDSLPFFIRYAHEDPDHRQADYDTAGSPAMPGAISRLVMGGDPKRMTAWLGSDSLPLHFIDALAGLHAVVIESPSGEIVIRNEDLLSSS